jgi:hypothetical protein
MKQEHRPCPICHGDHPESCEVCKGRGWFPYPWVFSKDTLIRKRWTSDETDIIKDAVSGREAYQRYISIYGTSERSYSSVYRHWQYVNIDTITHPNWSIPEVEILRNSDRIKMVINEYHLYYGAMRTDRAIRAKFYEVRRLC